MRILALVTLIASCSQDTRMETTAWTGTNTDGTLYTGGTVGNTCGNWDDLTSEGMVGNSNGSGLAWSLDCNVPCNYATALYCFEQ
ncbi:MAG TPA: hypothetical protein VF403_14085 [Kofleriaceae bacterium]